MTDGERTPISELSHDEAIALLARNSVGRIAYTFRDRVDVEPISYVYADGWLYARTSEGTKLTTLRHHPWVAFEVDEIEGRNRWRSAVVHGTIYWIDAHRSDRDRVAYEDAVAALRSVDPTALTDADHAPHRTVLFRIRTDEITSRKADSA
jgi:nitroimidazol reductase NimA-like FMN-containing flavoprotein (pyridoxamine 5'-phosphate oxidase superfamily)